MDLFLRKETALAATFKKCSEQQRKAKKRIT